MQFEDIESYGVEGWLDELAEILRTVLEADDVVRRLNRLLMGWGNYFCLGPVSRAYRAVDAHTEHRLRQWLRRKHKVKNQGYSHYSAEYLYEQLGLVCLQTRTRDFPWAKV